ncbi:DNA translocase FtsK, partial [Bosea sp. (in: a-proteobacteria)]|uniref:DNA translocase FtsK n=3 Tax=Bosea TaxID=85413 RepID=UPI0025C2973E
MATSEYEAHPADESATGAGRGARAETAAIEMAPAQVYVRPGRTPGKRLQAQAGPEGDRQSPPLLFSGGHPPAVTLADSTRVRFWRTPKHLMREIWGAPGSEEPAQRPGQAETPDVADVIPVAEAAAIEVEMLDIWPEGDTVAEALPVPEADVAPRSAPFAFLSDHAFWDLVPEIGRDEGSPQPSSTVAPVPHLAFPDDDIADALPFAVEEAAVPPSQAMTAARPAVPPAGSPWAGYTVNLRVSLAPQPAALQIGLTPTLAVKQDAAPALPTALEEPDAVEALPVAKPASIRKAPARRPEPQMGFQRPPIEFLTEPPEDRAETMPVEVLQQNAGLLEGVLEDFNVRGEIVQACPGPVVTLYELEPAPGTKSSRVISLADDIARSMSAVSARVAVVQGKNAIGIELPNAKRETVFLR